jgi:uncharacterized protein with von Willebrand factor type A (vWA) domain
MISTVPATKSHESLTLKCELGNSRKADFQEQLRESTMEIARLTELAARIAREQKELIKRQTLRQEEAANVLTQGYEMRPVPIKREIEGDVMRVIRLDTNAIVSERPRELPSPEKSAADNRKERKTP